MNRHDESLRSRIEVKIRDRLGDEVVNLINSKNPDMHYTGVQRGTVTALQSVLDLIQQSVQEMNDANRA